MERERLEIERVAAAVIDSMVKVHKQLGPGLLETAYQACLEHELLKRHHRVQTEILIPIKYDGIEIDHGFRADMIIDDCLLIENKAAQSILPVHRTQVFTYLKLTGLKLGILANWNSRLMKDGISRVVNDL